MRYQDDNTVGKMLLWTIFDTLLSQISCVKEDSTQHVEWVSGELNGVKVEIEDCMVMDAGLMVVKVEDTLLLQITAGPEGDIYGPGIPLKQIPQRAYLRTE